MNFRIEICTDSIDSALIAQESGADSIELCTSLTEGGLTPSCGMLNSVRKNLNIRINVLIRPRSGDFLYSDTEFDIMRRDIEMCGEAGANGVVFGLLRKDGTVDTERTSILSRLAHPMAVTFHRAFDLCREPYSSLEDIVASGASRILTSGQAESSLKGIDLLKNLVLKAGKRLLIMPGGGLNESNIGLVARETGAQDFHLSARSPLKSRMEFRRERISMGVPGVDEYSLLIADAEKIRKVIYILRMI
jgi:copper homeostasis protein